MYAAHLDAQSITTRCVVGSPLLPSVAAAPKSSQLVRLAADLGAGITQRTPG